MTDTLAIVLAATIVVGATALALAFRPFAVLREPALRGPLLAALILVPLAWNTAAVLPGGPSLQFSFGCLLVLMFGWPLAVIVMLPGALLAVLIKGAPLASAIELAAWQGVLPASFGLVLGIGVRRFLPHQVFVYILGRGFIVTALAIMAAGALAALVRPLPAGTSLTSLLIGNWLMAWAEAVLTGMLTAIFVAYRPRWLLTWSDQRYLLGH